MSSVQQNQGDVTWHVGQDVWSAAARRAGCTVERVPGPFNPEPMRFLAYSGRILLASAAGTPGP